MTSRRVISVVLISTIIAGSVWKLAPSGSFDDIPLRQYLPSHGESEWDNRDSCDPYLEPGHLHINNKSVSKTYYESFNPNCVPGPGSWIERVKSSAESGFPIPELQNKELLNIGDSVDRTVIMRLCNHLGVHTNVHPLHTFQETTEETNGGLARSCYIPHLNLTLANWFFYGYDETDMWTDKKNTYQAPGEYSRRYDGPSITSQIWVLIPINT
jgi:hypothetical protein